MSTLVGAEEASRLLGVSKATLYAYVSRGLVERTTAVDGRTSLYRREQLEELARSRSGRRRPFERPSIDVLVGSAITELRDDALRYRGLDAVELAATSSFEQVAELLWTGERPGPAEPWPLDTELLERCRRAVAGARPPDGLATLALAAATSAEPAGRADSGAMAARRLIAIAPSLLGGPDDGTIAERLAHAWTDEPGAALAGTIDRALVMLADHELATSTLAVRVACSVRCDPADALATGLHVLRGPLHGTAARLSARLLDRAVEAGAGAAVSEWLDAGDRLPGFGHTVYRRGDPRFGPLVDAIRTLPDPQHRRSALDDVIAEAGRRLPHAPNVDLALGALTVVADLPRDIPIFAVARMAGWAAHYDEERTERPVRYRGLATRR